MSTWSTSDEYPPDIIVWATMAVAMTMPVTFPEFRERFTSAETTPCLLLAELRNIPALFGDMKIPEPQLKTMIDDIVYVSDDVGTINPIMNSPTPQRESPKVVKGLL